MWKLGEKLLAMFDTQKEWIGWIFAWLSSYMGVKIINMPEPNVLHVQVFMFCAATTVGLVAAKLLPELTALVRGVPKQ
ncbi:hypothetical protein LCGC14_0552500 [marine sediment metagenome]|uniref:Uncharacterized protein n=1 Tax=marine sediment metagenome TaxID=412755 RepID=A0A0F9S863_9ZZZZ